MRFTTQLIVFGLAVICLPAIGFAQKKKVKNPHSLYDLEYAKVDGAVLKLDLLMPTKNGQATRVGGVRSWRILAERFQEELG